MARTSATISVGADTRQLERDIQRALGRDFKFKGLNEKAFTQPLGRITGASNEFQKSLDASNARVIAFGASAGLIYSVEKAFSSLVRSTIDVQKSLTDINVILNVSSKSLAAFGGGLFNIAKDTAQSFDTVAQAATEFSRQGLGLEETLKRTRDALILTRLSGLDTVASVEALTATINSFSNAALDSTTIINKLANVDAAFAVSSADLAEAIKRVGSSAQDVGVDFDELLGIVTSVQQTTARGGAVIGNSLKTIFTRIQRTETLDQLEQLGIKVRTLEGNTLPAIQILSNLAGTFSTLGDSQRAQVAETVGGIFQINILKAALADLGKEYSVYNRALQTSAGATDQAIARNQALNETLSALINRTFVNLTQLGADFGKISLQPTFQSGLELLNKGLESISSDSQGIGSKIAKGIFEGIGTFVSGPGVILVTAVFGKLFLNLAKFAGESLKALLNLNTQSEQRAQIQAKISQVLSQEPTLVQAIFNKQISVLDVENKILNIIRQQTIERQKAASIATAVTSGLIGKGVTAKGGVLKAKSGGFIPNFAMSEIFGALAGGYNPGSIKRMNIPGEGPVTYNSAETVKQFPGMSQPAIMPPQGSKAGKNYQSQFDSVYGFNPYANNGFVPNFALGRADAVRLAAQNEQLKRVPGTKTFQYGVDSQGKPLTLSEAEKDSILKRSPAARSTRKELDVSSIASILLPFIGSSRKLAGPFSPKGKSSEFAITNVPVYGMKKAALEGDLVDDKRRLFTNITDSILNNTTAFIDTLKPLGKTVNKGTLANAFSSSGEKGAYGAVRAAVGSAFEIGVKTALNYTSLESGKDFGDFDVRGGKNIKNLQKLFGFSTLLADFKGGLSTGNLQSFAAKIYKEEGYRIAKGKFSTVKGKKASDGFIPNFSTLNEAIDRELTAGVSPSRVRIGKDKRLTSAYNPLGLGVYNTKDEPLGLGQGVSRAGNGAKTAGAASGFIPNFVNMPSEFMGDPKALQYQISVLTETQNKSTKQLIKDFRELSRETKNASKGFEKFGGAALAFSFGIPIILQTLSQFSSNEDIKTQAAINGISTAISMIGTGAFVGAGMGARGGIYGAAAGAVTGGAIATYQFLKALDTEDLVKLQKNLQFLQDEFQSSQSSLQKVIPLIEEYKRVQASAADEQTKAFNLEKILNEISTGLGPLGEETVNKVLEAFKNADYDTISLIINKKLAESSAQLSNEGVKILLEEFKTKGKIEDPATAKVIGKSLLSLQASTGESVIRKLAQTEEGKQRIDTVSKNLEKLQKERNDLLKNQQQAIDNIAGQVPELRASLAQKPPTGTLQDLQERLSTIVAGASAEIKADPLAFFGIKKGDSEKLSKLQTELNTNLSDILSTIEPLYRDTEETRAKFAEWKIASGNTALNQESSSALIEQIVKDLKSQGITTKEIDEILRVSAITSIEEYVQAFRNNTLTLRKADEFVKNTLFKRLQDPLEILGKEQGALIQNIGQDILTPSRRNRVYDEIDKATEKLRSQLNNEIIRRERLDAQLANKEITEEQYQKDIEKTIITEDQYRKRLEALREKILLDQRKIGGIFAEDFRGGRQETREARILGQETQLQDFSAAFFDEFDYRTEDSFREAQLGAKETARTIKSEFNNAFFDFAQGTATAGQAFEKFALNISNKIQQLALEFSTNLLFGKLFGSTSNIFGLGGGGGGGGGFGSLFGFKKGGVVKGYSSGGTVTGGSGTKDDVPAMLSAGEYVIKKSAVNKYGPEYLQMLNEGKVEKRFGGGFFGVLAAMAAPIVGQSAATNPTATSTSIAPAFGINTDKNKKNNYFKYGGRVQRFANGGQASFINDNYFKSDFEGITVPETGQTLYRPKDGSVIAPNLNLRAILDSSNPQNEARRKAEDFYNNRIDEIDKYLQYVDDVRKSNEEAYKENQRLNQEIRDQYNQQKRNAEKGGWLSFLLGAGAAGSTFLASGGQVKKFAKGGSNQDNIPALLMDGEFVMRREAVNLYGKKFFDDLNTGRVKRFANGGSTSNAGAEGIISDSNYNSVNNVNITVNMSNNQNTSTSETGATSNEEQDQKLKLLSSQIKDQVIRTLVSEQRPGGILSSTYYSKR
jgi:TP901 family phage tail tape measure protein